MMDGQTIDYDVRNGAKGMYHLMLMEAFALHIFYGLQHIIEVSLRDFLPAPFLNLNHEYGVNILIVLLTGELLPMVAFLQPFLRGSLQHGGLVVFGDVFRVCY